LGELKKRKIMKNYIKNLTILGVILMFTSCLVEDTAPSDNNDAGPNLIGFSSKTQNLSAVSDGNEYDFTIKMEVKGPTSETSSAVDATATISIDPSSTAIEGVHFRLDSKTITLTKDNNYLGLVPITVITDGIVAPLPENPKLILNVASATGQNLVANGNVTTLTFVYQCFADLSGTYLVTNDFCDPSFTTTITANPDGSWHIGSADGGFLHQCTSNTSLLNPGNIVELCGDILPTGDLDFGTEGFSGAIGDISGGTWDAENGILTMQHTEAFFTGGPYAWTSTYTRQ